ANVFDAPDTTCAPSIVRVYVYGALPPLAAIATDTPPLTVAPCVGLVNAALSDVPAFWTLTLTAVLPTAPRESRTVACRVCVPFATGVLSHGIVTGPLEVSVPVASVCAPTLSVNVLAPLAAPLTHIVVQIALPLTTVPLVGCVMNSCSVVLVTCTYT